jgi:hypothetical protein
LSRSEAGHAPVKAAGLILKMSATTMPNIRGRLLSRTEDLRRTKHGRPKQRR